MSDPTITVRFEPAEADHYRALRDAGARNVVFRGMILALFAAPQAAYDLDVERDRHGAQIDREVPVFSKAS